MICQGTCAVLDMYHVVVNAGKVIALNCVFALSLDGVMLKFLTLGKMQTQHKVEMDKRDGMFGPQAIMAVPPMQQMSRIDQPTPPAVGYPPQQAYAPYGQPPPPYFQGFPPAGTLHLHIHHHHLVLILQLLVILLPATPNELDREHSKKVIFTYCPFIAIAFYCLAFVFKVVQ
ncbi:hypothetical protein GH714_020348 [Hevea brasiliensis]|uniref:Uncharacterized protein n=1 Tax=Hevea brasiliensis TaxID=3981 RepID=A0A6A6KSV3_HEVBR|nr:hypothetical protein GH714_020348 [Hevea brasiliensis]